MAVLTKGDSAIVNATDLACSVFLALPILILIFVAPSASSTAVRQDP